MNIRSIGQFFGRGGRLRNKIFLMMAVVGVVPIIAVGYLALASIDLFHQFDLASIEGTLLDQKAEELRGLVNELASTFALRVGYEERVDPEQDQQDFVLHQLLVENPSLEEVAFVNVLDPKLFPGTSVHAKIPVGRETSRHARYAPDGASPDDLLDIGGTEKFRTALGGKGYVSPVFFTLRGPAVSIASPVRNKLNEIVSVLTGTVNLSDIQKIIGRSRLGTTGYLYVVDQDGYLLARSDRTPSGVPERVTGFAEEVLRGAVERGPEGLRRHETSGGVAVVAAGNFIRELGWGIVAEWPVDDADRVLVTVRNQVLGALALVLLLTVAASIMLANRIVGPIRVLESGTERVAEGKFDEPVKLRTGDEIEDLGAAFNKMMQGLKQLQELKDEFTFIAAHELRTPVAAIKGYLSLVMDGAAGPVSESVKDFIGKVVTANQRLIQLVNDLLEIARSEAGRLTVKVVPLDIREPVRSVLSELKPLADEKQITIAYEPSTDIPQALGDSDRLKEVVVNLIGNAVKYSPARASVTVTHEIKDGTVVTHIKDTGFGIPKDAQAKLFEKFYRVQTKDTASITGTGLGLFIVKQIVEKMNGKIWVESEEGKGSTFSFSLPMA